MNLGLLNESFILDWDFEAISIVAILVIISAQNRLFIINMEYSFKYGIW